MYLHVSIFVLFIKYILSPYFNEMHIGLIQLQSYWITWEMFERVQLLGTSQLYSYLRMISVFGKAKKQTKKQHPKNGAK